MQTVQTQTVQTQTPQITPDTTDAELEAQVQALPLDQRAQRLRQLRTWRDMAVSHSIEEPTGLRQELGIE